MSYLPAVGTQYQSLQEFRIAVLEGCATASVKMGITSGSSHGSKSNMLRFHCSVRSPRRPMIDTGEHNTNYCSSVVTAREVGSIVQVTESEESHTCPRDAFNLAGLDAGVEMKKRLDDSRSRVVSEKGGRKSHESPDSSEEGEEDEEDAQGTPSHHAVSFKRRRSAHGTSMTEGVEDYDDLEVEEKRSVAKVSKRTVEMGPPQARYRSLDGTQPNLSPTSLSTRNPSNPSPPSFSFDPAFASELASFLRTFSPPSKDLSHDVAILVSAGITNLDTFMSILMMEESSIKHFVDMVVGDQKSLLPPFEELEIVKISREAKRIAREN